MTSTTDREEFLAQVEEAMKQLPSEVLYGKRSVSHRDLPRNSTVAREVTSRLTRMRLNEIKERRYSDGKFQLSFPSSGGPPHYLGDLRHYNEGRPHAPLRYDKPWPLPMTEREKKDRVNKESLSRTMEDERLVLFSRAQEERHRRVEHNLFDTEDMLFAASYEDQERGDFMASYESLPISSHPSYDELD